MASRSKGRARARTLAAATRVAVSLVDAADREYRVFQIRRPSNMASWSNRRANAGLRLTWASVDDAVQGLNDLARAMQLS